MSLRGKHNFKLLNATFPEKILCGRTSSFLESFFHAGDLDFKEPEKSRVLSILNKVPTIVDIYLDRPAVIPEMIDGCDGLIANFGASDSAVLDVIFGRFSPSAKLPFELPSSMDAVKQQNSDVPYDSTDPLYEYGFGLRY
jgi:beta-glucosidase